MESSPQITFTPTEFEEGNPKWWSVLGVELVFVVIETDPLGRA